MPSGHDLKFILDTLQSWADDPSLIDDNPRAKTLIAKIHREGSRGQKLKKRAEVRERDRAKTEETALVRLQTSDVPFGILPPATVTRLEREINCYICKVPFDELHSFYHRLCPACAAFNFQKRHQRADLHGRWALVTGGRIKIGFELSHILLRDGANVIVTTRFPDDAWKRYEKEPDFAVWAHRLQIVGLDLRFMASVEEFCQHLNASLPHLDILVNNAAQTIKRPDAFYAHLLPESETSRALAHSFERFFPPGKFDRDGQQIDLRQQNSWSQTLGEVDTLEAAENYLVNALAPFVLSGKLRPLLKKSPHPRRFIVHASAMEGNFSRFSKTSRHPHTNMGKAALNMLVRTSAADLRTDGIYTNAVDTGWITDENPFPKATRLRDGGFVPPLDSLDGAARLYDPIAIGLNEAAEPVFGHFIKDYAPHNW